MVKLGMAAARKRKYCVTFRFVATTAEPSRVESNQAKPSRVEPSQAESRRVLKRVGIRQGSAVWVANTDFRVENVKMELLAVSQDTVCAIGYVRRELMLAQAKPSKKGLQGFLLVWSVGCAGYKGYKYRG